MKQYDDYQVVAQKWVDEIPEHWDFYRIKRIFAQRVEKNDPVITENILSLTAKQGVVPIAEKEGAGGNKPKGDMTQYNVARPDDLLVNCMNIVSGSAGVSRYFGAISPVYYALYPRLDCNVWYYHYLFRLMPFQRSLLGLGKGILMHESDSGKLNTVRMRISMDYLGNVPLPVPPRTEQDQIVRYLDWQVSKVNRLIAAKKKQIELLKEQKQVRIDDTCFSSALRDSTYSTEWGRSIPVGWDTVKLNGAFSFGKGLQITKANLTSDGIPVISYGQVHAKTNTGTSISDELIRFVAEEYLSSSPSALVNVGDYIFADTSEDFAGVGNCVYVDKEGPLFAGYHTIIIRPTDCRTSRYTAYLFKTTTWRYQLQKRVNGVKVFSVTQKILKDAYILIPPKEEQERIVRELDNYCNAIDLAITSVTRQIETLVLFRTRLIFDVVTGQIDVRDVEIPDFEYISETDDNGEDVDEEESDDMAEEEV